MCSTSLSCVGQAFKMTFIKGILIQWVCLLAVVWSVLSAGRSETHDEDLITSRKQILSHIGMVLQDLQEVAVNLESKLDSTLESNMASLCVDDLASLVKNASHDSAIMQDSLGELEARLKSLQQDMDVLQNKLPEEPSNLPWLTYPAQRAPYTVSVTGEGGCCAGTQEHQGPWFSINGKAIPFPRQRGFNIVALDRRTGNVVRTGRFDTYHPDVSETVRMVDFINNGIPEDSVVLVGSYDSSQTHCQEESECQAALRMLGSKRTSIGVRDSYTLIGYKGNYCGISTKPSWVKEAHDPYPGQSGREGKQSRPVTVQATIKEVLCD